MSDRAFADPQLEERRRLALRHVRQYGDPVLRTPAEPIARFDDALRLEAERMGEMMVAARGVGLAAPQLGRLSRLIVMRSGEDAEIRTLCNPEIVWRSEDEEVASEGCLSIGEITVDVARAVTVRVRAQDAEGTPFEEELEGFEARIVQHEIDHLDGILILDRAPAEQRKEALRELRTGGS